MVMSVSPLSHLPLYTLETLTDSLAVVGREEEQIEVDGEHAGQRLARVPCKVTFGNPRVYHNNALDAAMYSNHLSQRATGLGTPVGATGSWCANRLSVDNRRSR